MKKLISMTDFIFKTSDNPSKLGFKGDLYIIRQYAKFLKQLLELCMFVPCKLVDGVWVVLEEPKEKDFWESMPRRNGKRAWNTHRDLFEIALREYQQAKEKCLFEGYDGSIEQLKDLINLNLTIENMVKYNLELTPTAQKQIGI